MRYIVLLMLIVTPAMSQTVTVTRETIREESTVVTVVRNNTATVEELVVPVVYNCNGRTCVKPQ